MRIVVLGSSGQVGWESLRALAPLGEVIGLDTPEIDLTRPDHLRNVLDDLRPQVIFNAAAYTAVDRAESEPEKARLINSVAAGALAENARRLGAVLVHFSTDYVFDGKKGCTYTETDVPNPLSVYGQTKLEGEQAIQAVDCAYLILRTAWVYSMRRDSFVSKVLQWSQDRLSIRVVMDQVSNPTWARMLAEVCAQLLAKAGAENPAGWVNERRGLYHLAGSGFASRMDWARAILNNRPQSAPQVDVIPALTSEFPAPAERPLYSALDCSRFAQVFNLQLPAWEKALRLAMDV